MDNKKNIFKAWYKAFLLNADSKHINAECAQAEADRVADMVDAETLVDMANGEYCRFCADDGDVKSADCYGLTDLGNNQPEEERKIKIGGSKTGTVLPIVLPACKRCRRNYLLVQNLPTAISTAIIAATLIIVNIPAVKNKIYEGNLFVPTTMRPFFIFAVVTAICVLLCAALRRLLIEKLSEKTVFNIMDIKRLAFLREGGWFRLYNNKHFSQILFSDEKPQYMQNCECDEEHCADCCDTECDMSYEKTVELKDAAIATGIEAESESRNVTEEAEDDIEATEKQIETEEEKTKE